MADTVNGDAPAAADVNADPITPTANTPITAAPQAPPAPAPKYSVPSDLMPYFKEAADKSGVPLDVLIPIAKQESSFKNNETVSSSSAKGIFQFTDGTWASMMKQAAPIYGLPTTSSVFDPRANILMGAEFARMNGEAIRHAFGRAPQPGEYYISHFLGTQGGINFIHANEKSPDASAAALFPQAAHANPTIFFDKAGAPRTVSQVNSFLTGVVTGNKTFGVDANPSINFTKPIAESQLQGPPLPPDQAAQMTVAQQMADREKQIGFFDATKDAFKDTLTARLLDAGSLPQFAPDINYRINETDLDAARKQGVMEDNLPMLGNAVSKPHFDYLVDKALASQQRDQDLSSYGWSGTGLRLAAGLLDPVSMAAGIASGGLADYAAAAANFGRVGRIAAQAVGGAATNLALDQSAKQMGDPAAGHSLLYTAALGALFGGAFGAIAHNPAAAEEAQTMANAANSLRKDLLSSTSLSGNSVGAAANTVGPRPFLHDEEWSQLVGTDVPKGRYSAVRYSSAGQLLASPNPGARLGAILGEDAVGGSKDSRDVVNPISTSERATRRHAQWQTDFENTFKPAYDEWAKENNLSIADKLTHSGVFGDLITRYVREDSPEVKGHYSPAVQKAGNKLAAIQKDILELAQNPLRDQNMVGRPVKGFETVPENPNYMMRITDARKLNEVVDPTTGYGEQGMIDWYKGAMRSAQPWIEDDILNTIARNTVRNSYQRANHIDEQSNLMFSGYDQDQLRTLLDHEGVERSRIDALLGRLTQDEKTGADARAQHRLLLDENYALPYKKITGEMGEIRLRDFTVTDAYQLSRQYFQHMAGRIELAATRVKNPTTGKMLVDGITSDSDFTSFRNRVKQMAGEEMSGGAKIDAKQTDKDLANIQWLYDRILGRPDPSQLHPFSGYARLFRKLNFLRLMGSVGFSQIQDWSSGVAQLGLKAVMQQLPAVRRIINMDGESVLRHGLDRELEALMGRDPLMGLQHWRDEDFAPALPGMLGKIDNALNTGQHVMSKVSGLDFINAMLTRNMGKAVVQKFADLARRPSKANMRRMMSIGLDEDMVKRILDQTKHFTQEDGILGRKVTAMNLPKWDDAEARAAFENGVFRWTRRVVQQNDYGQAHRWSSNPLWQALFQFRSFALAAWEKQFLHNVAMRDWNSFHMMWSSMALAAMTYAVRTNLQAIGRSDREDFLKKRLAPAQLSGAAFQMAGWSSIMPMIWDSGLRLGGFNPWFDFRATGQATDALIGNPTVDFINSVGNAMKGTTQSFADHRQMSQQELRNWTRIAPFGNWAPAIPIFNSMISSRPAYAPNSK